MEMGIKHIVFFTVVCTFISSLQAQSVQISSRKYEKTVRKTEKKLTREALKNHVASGENVENATPDLYWVQEYIATMNPALKRPTPETLLPELVNLNRKQVSNRAQPGQSVTPWVERGPDNVGGRTRALAWDPTDGTGKKVWAGAVTGGLWYNTDITSSSNKWVQAGGVWSNLTVTAIAFDPNNQGIMYVGTGEGFGTTASTSRGFGIWKSTDTGKTFSQLSSTSSFYYINDIVVRNESGSSVVYAAVDANYYAGTWHGTSNYGLQRSTNGGSTWSNVSPNAANGSKTSFADLEIAADNRLWAGTRKNPYTGNVGGGRVMYSDNGTTWTAAYTHTDNTGRVEVACAPGSKYTLYALVEVAGKLDAVMLSQDRGANWTSRSEPDDADNGIDATDFTRGQAWYDLILAVDPNDSNTVIAGGIDLFRSTNAAGNWTQISKWSNNANLNTLNCPYVHADQHAILFKAGSSNTCIFGTDGGVFYTTNISGASSSGSAISSRNKGYNVTQFYWGDISQTSGSNAMIAGSQDNGSHKFTSGGINSTTEVTGGDGAYCFIAPSNVNKQISSYVYNQYYYTTNNWSSTASMLNDGATGKFINPAEWDDNGPGLFSGKGTGTAYRVPFNTTPGSATTITWGSAGAVSALKALKLSNGKTRLLVGTDGGKVYISADAWATTPSFSNITGTINVGNISGFDNLRAGDTMAVVLSNYGVSNIYISTNGGSSWSARDGNLADMPVWSILLNPNNLGEAIIATELGIYGTSNIFTSSPAWTPYQSGMGPVKVATLRYRAADKVVMAVTHGRGVFTSDAWSKVNPIAKFGADKTDVCTNQNVSLLDSTLNTPTSWSWAVTPWGSFSYRNGTDSTSQNPVIRFHKGGSYTVKLTATNTLGSNVLTKNSFITATDTIPTSSTLAATKSSLCAGDSLTIFATVPAALNGTISTYQWKRNGNNTGSGQGFLIQNPAKNDSFQVILTSTKKCASPATFSSNIFKPTVNDLVNASAKLTHTPGCAGRALSVSVSGINTGGSPVWDWYIDGNVQTSHGGILSIANPANGSKVYATVNVAGPCVRPANLIYSDTAVIVVKNTPAKPTVTRNFDTLFASNLGAGTYTWYESNAVFGTGRVIKATKNGSFRCTYTENGCTSDSSTVLTFNSLYTGLPEQVKPAVYPNPTKHTIELRGVSGYRKVRIFNNISQEVTDNVSMVQNGMNWKADVSRLPAGQYIIRIDWPGSHADWAFYRQ
ncbi:MAG: hypothetical protein JNL57_06590 [Bacteroidetes bacterium]|nr:hypothetical protein [Bacteroidota bacterium]